MSAVGLDTYIQILTVCVANNDLINGHDYSVKFCGIHPRCTQNIKRTKKLVEQMGVEPTNATLLTYEILWTPADGSQIFFWKERGRIGTYSSEASGNIRIWASPIYHDLHVWFPRSLHDRVRLIPPRAPKN